jgi:hypothetical protein
MWKENLDRKTNPVDIYDFRDWLIRALEKLCSNNLGPNSSSKDLKEGYHKLEKLSVKLDKLSQKMELNGRDKEALSRLTKTGKKEHPPLLPTRGTSTGKVFSRMHLVGLEG